MENIVKYLEAYVEWIVLGVAVLFLGWVVWAYALHSQVQVSLGSTPVQPGELETRIYEGPITKLSTDMNSNQEIAIAVPDPVQPWLSSLGGNTEVAKNLPSVVPWDPSMNLEGPHRGPIEDVANNAVIDKWVTPPTPEPVAAAALRTTVQYPDPKQPLPANNDHAQQVIVTTNIDAISVLFKVNMKKLGDQYGQILNKRANIPPSAYFTEFLKVDLIREEKLADGTWGNRVTVKPLFIHPLMDYPGDDAPPEKALEYRDWAGKHFDEMIHPEFFQTAQGAPVWHRPDQASQSEKGQAQPVIAPAPAPPAGNRLPPGFVPPGVRPNPRGPGNHYAPNDPDRPSPGQYPGGYRGPGAIPPYGAGGPRGPGGYPGYPGYPGAPGYPPYPGQRPYAPVPGVRSNQGNDVPFNSQQGGMFDPTKMNDDIEILAHDDTVQPGKTYRYRLQYRIYNSLYDTTRIAKLEIAKQFGIVSAESEPTEAVSIPDRTNFFVKGISATDVRFDVFTWEGVMKVKEVRAGPGDAIGATNWSVVDIRRDGKRTDQIYALLSDSAGHIQRRDFRVDQDSTEYKNLLDQVKSAPGAASAR